MSQDVANQLWNALQANEGIAPIRSQFGENDLEAAYETQRAFNQLRLDNGQELVGRKAGFTNPTAQGMMGVDVPVHGLLFDVMDVPHRGEIPANQVTAPKIEAEIAFIIGADLDFDGLTLTDVMRAVDYVAPAIEIVNTRIANWEGKGVDMICDNIGASHYTIGHNVKLLDQFDVSDAKADILVNGTSVGQGAGANVLGSPLNSLYWLAKEMVKSGTPIAEGDVILSGSLGPMVPVNKGDTVEVHIEGAGMVSVSFAAE